MPIFIRVRWIAFRLVRTLRRSMLQKDPEWELDSDTRGRPILMSGPFRILIVPRAVRLIDAVHLYCDGVEIWLPIVARLRLRNAVRLFLLQHASENLPKNHARPAHKSRSRRRKQQEQTV